MGKEKSAKKKKKIGRVQEEDPVTEEVQQKTEKDETGKYWKLNPRTGIWAVAQEGGQETVTLKKLENSGGTKKHYEQKKAKADPQTKVKPAEELAAEEEVDKTQKEYNQAGEKKEMEEDTAGEPAAENPADEKQTTEDPTAEEPVAEKPTSEELAAEAINTAAKLLTGQKGPSEAIPCASKADALRKADVPRVQVR